jgi:hypothetical protein
VKCTACQRGYCKKCEKTNSITQHQVACSASEQSAASEAASSELSRQPAQIFDNHDANTEPQPQVTADEFQDFLAQIEDDEATLPTSSTTSTEMYDEFDDFLDQIEEDNLIMSPSTPLQTFQLEDGVSEEEDSTMLQKTEDLNRIRNLLKQVSRNPTVCMSTRALETAVARAETEENEASTSAPQNASRSNDLPQTLTKNPNHIDVCVGCGSKREIFPCSKGHPLCRRCKGNCPSCSSRNRIQKRLEF